MNNKKKELKRKPDKTSGFIAVCSPADDQFIKLHLKVGSQSSHMLFSLFGFIIWFYISKQDGLCSRLRVESLSASFSTSITSGSSSLQEINTCFSTFPLRLECVGVIYVCIFMFLLHASVNKRLFVSLHLIVHTPGVFFSHHMGLFLCFQLAGVQNHFIVAEWQIHQWVKMQIGIPPVTNMTAAEINTARYKQSVMFLLKRERKSSPTGPEIHLETKPEQLHVY